MRKQECECCYESRKEPNLYAHYISIILGGENSRPYCHKKPEGMKKNVRHDKIDGPARPELLHEISSSWLRRIALLQPEAVSRIWGKYSDYRGHSFAHLLAFLNRST
jgi:hypothetical protein